MIEADAEQCDGVQVQAGAGLPKSARQEQFSLGFVHMVAAAAGCWIKTHATDYDGVDVTIASSARYRKFYGPQFELQLKCTTQHRYLTADHLAWPMKAKAYTKLVCPDRFIPAYLGVLLIPGDGDDWLDQDDARLLTHSRLYYERATNLGNLPLEQDSRTVHLPRSNLFDVAGLEAIMAAIGDGGDW
ncbi:DUF4365 domain-containing protein [Actinokineospora spheciospongiae]|uniref:DUF4365 domain-containing protein n=1 Tax=Actinokineospora spheciospongiae TaxID=909613 RepID=UPI000D70A169|nr:DUF4365 domain-containing protein [Actinokineospora spheciospongiae]PWW65616.1 uncharacterized protein DUF4365 [Actinokineospora spheciospongiae]